ncbi:MAG: endonuclease III domain-containing protein [Solirubrobacteraceae bacterium]
MPRSQWRRPSRRRVVAVRDRLRRVYGIPIAAPHGRPVDELILTVLSQSTSDRNRDVAFLRLRERFPGVPEGVTWPPEAGPQVVSWEQVRDAPLAGVQEAIQPGGLHRQKAVRIQQILRALPEPGDLAGLGELGVDEARERLCALPGVGRKTAACVLLFSLGMCDVPVDTHVSRVVTRLGMFRPGAPLEELHDDLLAMARPGEELELHVNLLRHGRRTCHAQRPRCGECALERMCPMVGVAAA